MDLVFAGIFALCFYLTGAELLLLWYPASLCLFFEFLFGFFDFLKFQEKHERLLMLCLYPKEAAEFLPDTNDAIEEDYKNLVRAFADIYRTERKANEKKTESAMEYMTLWTHQIKTPITAMQLLLQEPDETMISDRKRRELLDQLFEIEQYVDMALQYKRIRGTGKLSWLRQQCGAEGAQYFSAVCIIFCTDSVRQAGKRKDGEHDRICDIADLNCHNYSIYKSGTQLFLR